MRIVRRRPFTVELMSAVLAILILVFATAFSFVFGVSSAAADDKNSLIDVVLVTEPSSSDAALWGLARQLVSSVDKAGLDLGAGLSSEVNQVSQAYAALNSDLQADSAEPSRLLLEGVTWKFIDSYQEGTLPQSALFSAASSISPVLDDSDYSNIPVVTVTRSITDSKSFLAKVDALTTAMSNLDDTSLKIVHGGIEDSLKGLADDQLQILVSNANVSVSEGAQTELDQRLANSLPDLSQYQNGLLPDELLCEIPWSPDHRILCVAMDNFERMNETFKAEFGYDLPILDGYRPLSVQQYVHYNDPNWTAVPGTSNHGWGAAVDFNWDIFKEFDDPEVVWMMENGPKYGWRHPSALGQDTDRPEPWHFEFGTSYTGDDVADFEGTTPVVIYRLKTS